MLQWPVILTVRRGPDVISGQAGMLPAGRGDMFDHIRGRGDAFTIGFGERRFETELVPAGNGSDEQIQPGRRTELALEGSVLHFSKEVEEQRTSRRVPVFALVEPGGGVQAHFPVLPPPGQEDRSVNAPAITKHKRQPVPDEKTGGFASKGEGRA